VRTAPHDPTHRPVGFRHPPAGYVAKMDDTRPLDAVKRDRHSVGRPASVALTPVVTAPVQAPIIITPAALRVARRVGGRPGRPDAA
jgi:hypothetical protein